MKSPSNLCLAMLESRRTGKRTGIASLCTASGMVLAAAFRQAAAHGTPVLVESTANQVNQNGGYTGLDPHGFRTFVEGIARSSGLPVERLHLGGDHLGPLVWSDRPASAAMELAGELVRAYVAAGYGKIHLDTSMRLGDDPAEGAPPVELVARRGADLCRIAEETAGALGLPPPVYVVGSEVPVPGGAVDVEETLSVTRPDELGRTAEAYRDAFRRQGLEAAWERVVAFVVQPGVEFSDASVHTYDRAAAASLIGALGSLEGRVFEGHSTDYQPVGCLRAMVEDGIAVLKVGPALTYALREGLFALQRIEQELLPMHPDLRGSDFRETLEGAMLRNDRHWRRHIHGDASAQAFARRFGLSDRARYYLPESDVQASVERLLSNLGRTGVPPTLVSQYLPTAHARMRNGTDGGSPSELAVSRVVDCLQDYAEATGA